jgi:phosphotransferase system HPr (HPr) family protein
MLDARYPASGIQHRASSMSTPIQRIIVIRNTQGLHARPAEMFVRLAQKFHSRIQLVRDNQRVEARNIMDLLTLGAAQGTELVLEADGDDAQEAVEALAKLVEDGFPDEQASNESTAG